MFDKSNFGFLVVWSGGGAFCCSTRFAFLDHKKNKKSRDLRLSGHAFVVCVCVSSPAPILINTLY